MIRDRFIHSGDCDGRGLETVMWSQVLSQMVAKRIHNVCQHRSIVA